MWCRRKKCSVVKFERVEGDRFANCWAGAMTACQPWMMDPCHITDSENGEARTASSERLSEHPLQPEWPLHVHI